jgi:hypothetical protein
MSARTTMTELWRNAVAAVGMLLVVPLASALTIAVFF